MTEVKATAASRDVSEGASLAAPDLVALGDTGLARGDRAGCCGGGSGSCSPPSSLPADTRLKRLVDRFLPWAGLPVVLYFAAAIGALNLAPLLPRPGELALEGTAALAAGGWCGLNFWRCRHAHCLITGAGWLGLSLLALTGAGLGHSVIGGYERAVFLGVLLAGIAFEGAWRLARGTNAVTTGSRRIRGRGESPRSNGDTETAPAGLPHPPPRAVPPRLVRSSPSPELTPRKDPEMMQMNVAQALDEAQEHRSGAWPSRVSRWPRGQGALMTPEGRMRAAEAPKSCAESWDTKEIAPPPGTGWPCPVNWTG